MLVLECVLSLKSLTMDTDCKLAMDRSSIYSTLVAVYLNVTMSMLMVPVKYIYLKKYTTLLPSCLIFL